MSTNNHELKNHYKVVVDAVWEKPHAADLSAKLKKSFAAGLDDLLPDTDKNVLKRATVRVLRGPEIYGSVGYRFRDYPAHVTAVFGLESLEVDVDLGFGCSYKGELPLLGVGAPTGKNNTHNMDAVLRWLGAIRVLPSSRKAGKFYRVVTPAPITLRLHERHEQRLIEVFHPNMVVGSLNYHILHNDLAEKKTYE